VEAIYPDENAQLSKTRTPSYDAVEVVGALYPVLKPDDSRKGNWLSQAQQRQQALAGLESLCNSYCVSVNDQKSALSSDNFCQLFSQEVRKKQQIHLVAIVA